MEKLKRVSLTVESAPYEELRALSKELNLPPIWMSEQFNRLVKSLVPVCHMIVEQRKDQAMKGKTMTDDEIVKAVVRSIEQTQGVRLKDFLKE